MPSGEKKASSSKLLRPLRALSQNRPPLNNESHPIKRRRRVLKGGGTPDPEAFGPSRLGALGSLHAGYISCTKIFVETKDQ